MRKKSNWEVMQGQDARSKMEYRDVYEDQQLERSHIQEKQSPIGRTILAVVISVLVAALAWVLLSFGEMGFSALSSAFGNASSSVSQSQSVKSVKPAQGQVASGYPYLAEFISEGGERGYDYKVITDPTTGAVGSEVYDEPSDVPQSAIPDWYKASQGSTSGEAGGSGVASAGSSIGYYMHFIWWKAMADLIIFCLTFLLLYQLLMRNLSAQNLMNDTKDISQHHNDQHIALPEEVMQKFDFFPDAGAHSSVSVSSMISHVALSNKGIKQVPLTVRAEKDIVDENGDLVYLKGEPIEDDDGNVKTKMVPMFSKDFMEALFDASGALKDKSVRKYYDPTKIVYNPGNANRDKLKGYDTVADLVNGDWSVPSYETQTPAGAYVVDTQPVNTMVC